jgi:hypothetical protein
MIEKRRIYHMHNSKYAIAILALLLLTIVPVISAQATIDIEAKPDRVTVNPGQIFDVQLYVTPSTIIDTVALNISMWDPALAEVMEIQQGSNGQDPLFSDSTVWIGGKEIKNDLGYIKHIVWGSTSPTSTPGYLATITFKAKGTGEFVFNIPPGQFDAARAGERIQTNVLSASFAQEVPVITTPTETAGIDLSFFTWQVLIGIAIVISIAIVSIVVIVLRRKAEPKAISSLDRNPNDTTSIKVKRL